MRVASNAIPGACRVVPRHDATVGADFPASVRSTLSIPNTDNCPGVCRLVVISAVKTSPCWLYDPVYARTVSPPVIAPSLSRTTPVPSPRGVLNHAEYLPFSSIDQVLTLKVVLAQRVTQMFGFPEVNGMVTR